MKFAFNKGIWKAPFGLKIVEHCVLSHDKFPIDCAIAYFRNNEYPCKINRGFHEMFYVLEGECFIQFENETIHLKKNDAHLIETDVKHISRATYANVLIACTPPFDIKNVEFCSMS